MSPEPDLSPDGLVAALTAPDGSVYDVEVIEGFLGTAPDDRVRVYLSDDLKAYVDLPPDAIKLRRAIDDPADVAPRSRLWVLASALAEPAEEDSVVQLQDFLAGQFNSPQTDGPTKSEVTRIAGGHRHWPWPWPWPPPPGVPGYSSRMSGRTCCIVLPR